MLLRRIVRRRAAYMTSIARKPRPAPIVAAFRERYGVDILREPFDRMALRKLRGEFYTEFVWEASRRLRVAPGVLAAEAARRVGAKVNFRSYLNAFPRLASGPQRLAHLVREAREGGADGVILYENAAYLAAALDGSVKVTCPWLLEGFREYARPL